MTKETKKTARAGSGKACRIAAARQRRFLETLAETANVSRAAREAGVARSALYRLREQSATFRTRWQEAMDQALDEIEAMLMDRAVHGVDRPVFFGGKECGAIRHYSDTLAIFLLRARRPDIYGKVAAAVDIALDDPATARRAVHERLERMADRLEGERSQTRACGTEA